MPISEEKFKAALADKRIPVLILDAKWHQLFKRAGITPEIEKAAGGAGTSLGTGGMSTKINAAKIATEAGIDMVLMNGRDPEKLYDLFEDKDIGTIFLGKK